MGSLHRSTAWVATLVLHARTAALLAEAYPLYLADLWVALVMPPLGAWLWTRGAARPVAAVLLLQALLAVGAFTGELAAYVVAAGGEVTGLVAVAAWLSTFTWTPYLLLPTLVPLLHPGLRELGRPSRLLAAVVVAVVGAVAVVAAIAPADDSSAPVVANPLEVAPGWLTTLGQVAMGGVVLVAMPLAVLAAVVGAVRRARTGATPSRLVPGAAVVLALAILTQDTFPYPWNDMWVAVAFTGLAAALLVDEQARDLRRTLELEAARERAVRDAERDRLRADLHDGLGPELAGISLGLAALSRDVDDPEVREGLLRLRTCVADSVTEVRRLVDGLAPGTLDLLGLGGALARRAARLREAGLTVDLELDLGEAPVRAPVAAACVRVADEAATNVVRHAGAHRVRLACAVREGTLHLEVADDGRGPGPARRDGGVGIDSMRERARDVDGCLQVSPGEQGGTVVGLVVPGAVER